MVRMMSIRDYGNIDLSQFTLFELISAYLTEVEKESLGWKYLWYKVNYRKQLKVELRKKWSNGFIDIDCYFTDVENRCNYFLKLNNDFEKYIEKLIKIEKALDRKEEQRQLWNMKSIFFLRKTLRF